MIDTLVAAALGFIGGIACSKARDIPEREKLWEELHRVSEAYNELNRDRWLASHLYEIERKRAILDLDRRN